VACESQQDEGDFHGNRTLANGFEYGILLERLHARPATGKKIGIAGVLKKIPDCPERDSLDEGAGMARLVRPARGQPHGTMELIWIILAPLLAAVVAPPLVRLTGGRGVGPLLSLVPFGVVAFLLAHVFGGGGTREWSHAWMPSFGVDLALRLDGNSLLFALLVSFIGGLICIYAGTYLKGDAQLPKFFAILFLFMGSMLGVIVADDVILTFVFWELTSITSFLLIGFKHYDAGARKAALQSLLVTGGGGLALLAGLVLAVQITGSPRISGFAEQADVLAASPLFPLALVLILLGAFTKSAQVPFHFWLPGAMAAPTPVSAFLHSATMVKAGVILLIKLAPAMAATELWQTIVVPVGALTMLTGGMMAVVQSDLKKLLAYTTVSVLGALVLLVGLGDDFSLKTALVLVLAHGCYKGALFMIAGTVDHSAHTRDVAKLHQLGKAMPLLAVAAGLAALSMSGIIPTLGFISKELFYEAKLHSKGLWSPTLLLALGVVANACGVAVAIIVGVRPFFGGREKPTHVGHAPEWGLVLPPLVLAAGGLLLGLMPAWLDKSLVAPAATSLLADGAVPKLKLWHGFTLVLGLSALTLVLGVALFFGRGLLAKSTQCLGALAAITPTRIYDFLLDGLLGAAGVLTRWIQNGQLRVYVRVTLAASAGLILFSLILNKDDFGTRSRIPVEPLDMVVLLMMCLSSVAAIRASTRLTAILCLGGVGYSVALLFVAFGAPDLAITQLLVETLTVVLFSFVILKLPQIRRFSAPGIRAWDGLIATVSGIAMTLIVWKAMHVNLHPTISDGHVARSLSEANGRNVVNVILVDFRGFDTMGEILVLCLAGLGVTALMAGKKVFRGPAFRKGLSEGEAVQSESHHD
jgi:multicomponent Na+:H+ antiporter subunit A